MPPRKEPPPIEETMAAMVDSLTKLIQTTSVGNDKILASQTTSQSQLDLIVKQLATQYEQTSLLISTISQASSSKPPHANPPPHDNPPPHELQIRPPKLNLQTFDGSNPLDWFFQADQYFTFYKIEPPRRLSMIPFHLTGEALSWYKYLFNNHLLTTWDAFTRALEIRFGPSTYDNHQAQLFKLRQVTTVSVYQAEFEKLSNCVVGLSPEALLNCFISGLRTDIQQELSILRPTTITQAIGLAKLIEDKLAANYPRHSNGFNTAPFSPSSTPPPPSSSTSPALLPTPPQPPTTVPVHRLTPQEVQARRSQGLCFRCSEKYHPGHRCNPPQFLLLEPTGEIPTSIPFEPDPGLTVTGLEDKTFL